MADQNNKLADLLGQYGKTSPSGTPDNASSSGLLDIINAFSTRPVVKEVWYNNRDIALDGYTFVACRFDNCRLSISSANFALDRCVIDPTCTLMYGGDITKIIQLFNAHGVPPTPIYQPFYPVRHPDGTISIGS